MGTELTTNEKVCSQVPALELGPLSKTFGSQTVLHDVSLSLDAGEVHALLGQNGSGKSTLIKVLAGYHRPDSNCVAKVFDTTFELGEPRAVRKSGVRIVHQDLGLVDDLDLIDNLALGQHYHSRRWLSESAECRAARQLLDKLGIEIDPRTLIRDLSPADRTMVAVARAMRDGVDEARLLVLDEVTAALTEKEAATVFRRVRRLREHGGTVLYVTHRLEEVFAIADRVTVLRDGRNVATVATSSLDHPSLVELIVGRPVEDLYPPPPKPRTAVVLNVRSLTGPVTRDVSLQVHRGEVVGVAGVTGSGREELPHLLFGSTTATSGTVELEGDLLTDRSPADSIAAGIALIPADRKRLGSTPDMTLQENLTLPRIPYRRFARWLSIRSERTETYDWLCKFEVTPLRPSAKMSELSGGNQQKVVLARWFRTKPKVLVLDEPTQGVDVGAKATIYTTLASSAQSGLSVLAFSSDLEELAAICDRVLVMRNGRIATQLTGEQITVENIGHHMLALEPDTRREEDQ